MLSLFTKDYQIQDTFLLHRNFWTTKSCRTHFYTGFYGSLKFLFYIFDNYGHLPPRTGNSAISKSKIVLGVWNRNAEMVPDLKNSSYRQSSLTFCCKQSLRQLLYPSEIRNYKQRGFVYGWERIKLRWVFHKLIVTEKNKAMFTYRSFIVF